MSARIPISKKMRKQNPRSTRISRFLPSGAVKPFSSNKKPSPKKSPPLSNKIAMNTLIRKFELMNINSLNNRIRQAEKNRNALNKKRANRGNYAHPNVMSNISQIIFKQMKKKR